MHLKEGSRKISNSDMTADASVSVRLNPFKSGGVELPILQDAVKVPWSPYGYILKERPLFTLHPLFHAGCYYVQDSSAMFVGHVFRRHLRDVGDSRPLRVLDLCAAPGGKTTDIAASLREFAGDRFELFSNEVMRQRVQVLCDNVAIWGDPNVKVISADPSVIGKRFPGYFDIIVADVPCSGEGMFRKDPSAQAQWSPALVDTCAARQRRILADVWPALREDGILIYSTCTYEDAENDSNLEWAASELGGEIFSPVDEFADYGVKLTRCGNILRVGDVPGEGQWAGALRKTVPAPCRAVQTISPLWSAPERGEMKGNKFVPNPDWALSIAYDHSLPEAALDKPTALHFLHRDTIVLPDAPKGFVAVTYKGVPLGFVNNLGTRCNNLHPSHRRILMDVTSY